jgi:sulfonate transport system substrate-binding protein
MERRGLIEALGRLSDRCASGCTSADLAAGCHRKYLLNDVLMPKMRFHCLCLASSALLLMACGGDDTATTTTPGPSSMSPSPTSSPPKSAAPSSMSPSPTSSPPEVAAPAAAPTLPNTSVPAGTTLRIADQFGLFASVLGLAGMDQDIPYDVEYTTLSPGVLQMQAFRAGEVDLGVVSPLGLVQAAAGAVELHAVGRWHTDFALYALVTAPGVSGIDGWEDVRGKRVAFQRDTMGEALVMLALADAGMSLADIDVVDIPHSQVRAALEGGDADVGVTGEPFVSTYLSDNPTATYVFGIENPMAQSTVIVAADRALEDPALSAAVAEYLSRLDRAFTKLTADRAAFTDLVVTVWNLDRGYVERILQASDGVRMESVPGDLSESYRRLTDLLADRGDISSDLDIDRLFDDRFAGLFTS